MLKKIILVVSLFLLPLPAAQAQSARTESIAAVVNDDAISASDISARMKLIMISSGLPNTAEIREKVYNQVLSILIDERLMLQEAARQKIALTDEDIQGGFKVIADQNNFTVDQFKGILQREGISLSTMYDQIRAQMSWARVVDQVLNDRVTITNSEVQANLDRIASQVGKRQYLVSSIFIPVESPQDDAGAKQLADRLVREILDGRAPFAKVASQFSQAAGASRGGDMGWVYEGQLPEALEAVLPQMQEGEMSKPVRDLTGYHILFLRKRNVLTEENMPTREAVFSKLGNEQLDRLQKRYLLDLKATAFIEKRGQS